MTDCTETHSKPTLIPKKNLSIGNLQSTNRVSVVGWGSHKVTHWTRAWLLTSHLDVGGVGCPPQEAATRGSRGSWKEPGRRVWRPPMMFSQGSFSIFSLEIHASLSLVLYSSFNLSFCSKVTQLQGLAPVGYSGAQLKMYIAASCCQTRFSRANQNIHLSLVI